MQRCRGVAASIIIIGTYYLSVNPYNLSSLLLLYLKSNATVQCNVNVHYLLSMLPLNVNTTWKPRTCVIVVRLKYDTCKTKLCSCHISVLQHHLQSIPFICIPYFLYPYYKWIRKCMSVCLSVHLFFSFSETDWDTDWHKIVFCPSKGSKAKIFEKTGKNLNRRAKSI